MRAILCLLLLCQTCAPLCMPRPIGLPYFTLSLRWQTCASLCMPRPISLPYFTSLFLSQTCMPLCVPHQIGLPYSTSSILWQTCVPLCMPHQVRLLYFTMSLLWLAFTPFTCSCCWLMPFLFLTRHWHCLCCCPLLAPALVITMIQNDKTHLLQRSVAEEDRMPKRFCNDDIVWINWRCKTQA